MAKKKKTVEWSIFSVILILVVIDIGMNVVGLIPVVGDAAKAGSEMIIELISLFLTALIIMKKK